MEIDITRFFETAETHDFSASAAELGQDAGEITKANALREAENTPLLTTESQLDAMRDFARSSGGWNDDEVAAWSPDEVNALFIQWISGDKNEMEIASQGYDSDSDSEIYWARVEAAQEAGRISGNIYRGDDNKVYFSCWEAPQDETLRNLAVRLQALQRPYFYKLEARMKHSGHYYHSGCMSVDVSKADDSCYADEPANADDIVQAMRDFADWIYHRLEVEYNYRMSDEQVDESIIANEYEFDESGRI